MHNRALNHALKAKCRLRIDLGTRRDHRRVVSHKLTQVVAQFVKIGHTGFEHFDGSCVIEQRQQ